MGFTVDKSWLDGPTGACAQLAEKAAALTEAEGRLNQLKAADARQRLDLEGVQVCCA